MPPPGYRNHPNKGLGRGFHERKGSGVNGTVPTADVATPCPSGGYMYKGCWFPEAPSGAQISPVAADAESPLGQNSSGLPGTPPAGVAGHKGSMVGNAFNPNTMMPFGMMAGAMGQGPTAQQLHSMTSAQREQWQQQQHFLAVQQQQRFMMHMQMMQMQQQQQMGMPAGGGPGGGGMYTPKGSDAPQPPSGMLPSVEEQYAMMQHMHMQQQHIIMQQHQQLLQQHQQPQLQQQHQQQHPLQQPQPAAEGPMVADKYIAGTFFESAILHPGVGESLSSSSAAAPFKDLPEMLRKLALSPSQSELSTNSTHASSEVSWGGSGCDIQVSEAVGTTQIDITPVAAASVLGPAPSMTTTIAPRVGAVEAQDDMSKQDDTSKVIASKGGGGEMAGVSRV
eukprot:CAMPEP_0179425954 /NCGR_PEP_ID=MMETSP0799-20121207/12462_1 /TAXON_ID=46947 /ORGANISM="Geminigera cryophila, Strain CCMP2564" /LENGTH=392 /DNA_ID=CAMNT_0021200637 /DNA_START=115 /DNA_END=1290 /DNA_ORIENTATION=+